MNRLITYTIAVLLCWGCQKDNLPPQNIPVINNVTVSGITESTALCTFTVTITEAIHSVGINYGTDSSQLTGDFSTNNISGNTFTLPLNNLEDEMVYYYKVYVRDKMSTYIYSEIGEFKTQSSPYGSTFSNGITPSGSFRDGDGTSGNPYLIANAQQLKKMVDDVNNGNGYANTYFKLTTDIQVTADEWIPIGYGDYNNSNSSFRGNFDGNGHTISGTLKSDKYSIFGFFGRLDGNAIIANLTIAATVRNEGNFASISTYTGAIAGTNYGEITNCAVLTSATITGGECRGESFDSVTGGIAGINGFNSYTANIVMPGKIIDCNNYANVNGGRGLDHDSQTGGIAGENYGQIINCKNTGKVMGNGKFSNTGGIAGTNRKIIFADGVTTINNCINQGTVAGYSTAADSYTGGIAGNSFGDIIDCTVSTSGTITAGGGNSTHTGGIAGLNNEGKITNCTVLASTTIIGGEGSYSCTGGIAGINYVEITNCTNNAIVRVTNSYAGGFVGRNVRGVIQTSLNTGNISGGAYNTGGLAGMNDIIDRSHIYSCCTNRGTVNGQAANDNNQIGDGKAVEPCPDGHTKR